MESNTFEQYPEDDFAIAETTVTKPIWQEKSAEDEAFYTAALAEGDDPVEQYQLTKDSLLTEGRDESATELRTAYTQQYDEIVSDNLQLLIQDPSIPLKDKQKAIAAAIDERASRVIDLRAEYLTEKALEVEEAANTPEKLNSATLFVEALQDAIEDDYKIDAIIQKELKKDWTWGDFALSMVPLNSALSFREFGEIVLGSDRPFLPGEIIVAYRDKLEEMRDLGGNELRQFLETTINAVNNSAGLFDNNTAIRAHMLNELFSQYTGMYNPEKDFDLGRWVENTVAILDAVAVGSVMKVAARGVLGITKGSKLATINKADPEGAKELVAAALSDDTGDLAKALGVTKEELVSVLLPKPDITGNNAVAAKGGDALDILLNKQTEDIISSTQAMPSNFTARQREGVLTKLEKDLVAVKDATYYEGMSTIEVVDKGVVYKAVYGLEDGGFLSAKDALARSKELFREDAVVKVVRKDFKTGTIVPVEKITARKGEYYFQVVDMRRYITANVPKEDMAFPPGSVFHGSWASRKLLTAPTARFSEWITRGGITAHQLGKVVENKLLDMIRKPFLGLGQNDKLKIVDRLQRASEDREWYTRESLIGEGWTHSQIDGAVAIKQMQNTIYMLNNRKLRDQLSAAGQSHISGYGYSSVGKPISLQQATKTASAFDPEVGSIIKLSPSQIEDIYANGNTLVKLAGREGGGKDFSDYVIMRGDTTLKPLPNTVLNYIPGYSTVRYAESYFVVENIANVTVNGVTDSITRTVRTAPSKTDAIALANRLQESADENITYTYKHGRELSNSDRLEQAEWELNRLGGKLFFAKRGEGLRDVREEFSRVQDPVESMLRTISTVSRRVSQDDWITAMKKQYVNTFGKYSNNTYPASVNTITSPIGQKTDINIGKAKALFEHIEHMDGVQDPLATNWKAFALSTGEWIEGTTNNSVRKWLGAKVISAGDNDPVKLSRGLTYNLFIAGNPFRQLLLQTQQVLFVAALNPKFALNPNGMVKQSFAISAGYAAMKSPELWKQVAPKAAKSLDMTVPEYTEFVKAFKSSGLVQEIESHTLARDGLIRLSEHVSNTTTGRIATGGYNLMTAPIRWSKRAGFDSGEYINRVLTWTMARDMWIKANPGKKWTGKMALDKIAVDAENFVLSMSRADMMPYQKGALSMLTQFFSIQHKALAMMLPNRLGGNKLVSTQQARRIALAQVVQWGAAGVGVQKLYEAARDHLKIDVPEVADKIIIGGMNEYLINSMIQAGSPDSSDLAIATSLAPASGIVLNPMQIFIDVLTGKEALQTVMFGASANAWGRIGDTINHAITLAGSRPDISSAESAELILKEGPAVFSGYSNYLASEVMRNLSLEVDKNGTPIAKELLATNATAYARFFGFRTHQLEKVYDHFTDVSNLKKSVKQDVDAIWGSISRSVTVLADDIPISARDAQLAKAEAGMAVVGALLSQIQDEDYKQAIVLELADRMRRDMNAPGSVVERYNKLFMRGYDSANGLEYMRGRLKGILTKAQMQDVDKLLDTVMDR